MQIMNMAEQLSPQKSSRRAKRKVERNKLFSTVDYVVITVVMLFPVEITVR